MEEPKVNVAEVVESLGGHPRDDEERNLEVLANEILILRDKLKRAEEAEGRAERRLGNEIDLRQAAETRATVAEGALLKLPDQVRDSVEEAIAEAVKEGLEHGAPLRKASKALPDREHIPPAPVG